MNISKLFSALAIVTVLSCVSQVVSADAAYPSRPIKVVLPFATGGQSDVVARFIAQRMSVGLGKPIIVENMAGAGGMIAAANVARAAPDGYTLFLANASTLNIAPHLQKRAPINPDTFTPITTVTQFPLVLVVNSNSSFKSLADIIAGAKSKPGKLSFASPGYGTTPHLEGEALMHAANVAITHVPYKGGGPALNDLLGGQVDFFFESPATLLPHIQAGKLRALAVTGKSRMPSLPDVSTVAEQGMPQLTLESWSAFVAPANTPPDIVSRLRTEAAKVLASKDVISTLRDRGFEATSSTPEELTRTIQSESRVWSELVKERKITVE